MMYSSQRRIYVSFIKKAAKDNSVCKKGESYIKVKNDKYSTPELFKCIEELDEKHPRYITISEPEFIRILSEFLKGDSKSIKQFVKTYFDL